MNLELDDQAMAHRLREELDGATYHRSTTSFAARSRTPIIAGVAGIASAVVAATVIGGVGSSTPALAWSPTPTAPTAADEAVATSACGADLNAGSQRAGNEPVFTLPPLVALDLRGTGGLATFADANMTFTCLLVRNGDGFERGPVIGEATGNSTDPATFGIVSATSTEWDDGRTIAMITGVAPASAAAVEIRIAGQPTATADVTDGRFAMWWFGTAESLSGTVSALDANGAELARTALGGNKGDSGSTRG